MDNNEIICISSINEMTEGLFGQVFLFIYEILPILELSNINVNNSMEEWKKLFPDVCSGVYQNYLLKLNQWG